VADEFSAIVSEVSDLIPDVEVGFATFDDYAMTPFGSPSAGDKPFILRQQITSDLDKVQNELSEVPLHSGFDSPESSMEALMQSAQGGGYDQNCDGIYDEMTDVRPFLADTTDPFNGTAGQGFSSSGDGGGELGGFGFRPHALPVVVFATDNYLRDPQAGYATPGGCPMDAGHTDVVGAFADLGGYIIGINTSPWHDSATPQMQRLAQDTQSIADTNGDGVEDDLLVFSWSGSSAEFRNTITHAIEDLVASITFSSIALVLSLAWGSFTFFIMAGHASSPMALIKSNIRSRPTASWVPKPSSMNSVGRGAPIRWASTLERAMRKARFTRKASPPLYIS